MTIERDTEFIQEMNATSATKLLRQSIISCAAALTRERYGMVPHLLGTRPSPFGHRTLGHMLVAATQIGLPWDGMQRIRLAVHPGPVANLEGAERRLLP